ncbi:MAG: photosystem II protein Psb27 [Cyanobacteriota bacterium]|jgi:photosystem II Psb27 protein|nr:photosystem II protein Psb27 [Cyanobacteriota bacterium]
MAALLRRVLSRAVALSLGVGLSLGLLLSACGGGGGLLSGNYVDDTVKVADTLLATIALPQDDAGHAAAESEARSLINDYMARYRPQQQRGGQLSFTTMQTALNSLAGHYANYANRPLPEALRSRLEKELKKAEASAVRGA